jgi:hypothetical protein
VKATADSGIYAGGFAGLLDGDISYCYAKATVDGTSNGTTVYVGGFVGDMSSADASYCYATGNVIGNGKSMGHAGGFSGWSRNLSNCYAIGDVFLDCGYASTTYTIYAGGLTGRISSGGSVNNCFAVGSVIAQRSTGNDIYVGGIVGDADTYSIQNSAALGASVTAAGGSGNRYIGRIFGNTTTTNKSNNRAYDGMRLYSEPNYAHGNNPAPVIKPYATTPFHDNIHGFDASDSDFRRNDIWKNAPPASGAPNTFHGMGFSDTVWIFITVGYYGYPILKGVGGVGVLGGQQ